MERFLMDGLVAWKDGLRRKPLILNGARQVGKTWLLREFGRTQFENVAYVNLDDNPRMREQFELGYDLPRLGHPVRDGGGRVRGRHPHRPRRDPGVPEGAHLPQVLLRGRARVRGGCGRLASGHHRARGKRVPRREGEYA